MAEETKQEIKQEPKQEPKADDKSAAELAATKAELEKYRAAEAKRADDAKKAEDEKRVKDGEAQKLLSERQKDLEAAKARADALEASARARVEKQIAVLPDDAKKRIELVKDSLPLDKLSELVDVEADSAIKAAKKMPPNAQPKNDRRGDTSTELDDEQKKIVRRMGKDPKAAAEALKIAERIETGADGVIFRASIDEMIERHQRTPDGRSRANVKRLSSETYNRERKE